MIAAMMLIMSVLAWRRRDHVREAKEISLLLIAAAFYSFGYAQELGETTLRGMYFWLHFQYIGIPWIPALWICIASRHVGRRIPVWILMVIPVLTLAGEWSDGIFHLYNHSTIVVQNGPFYVTHKDRAFLAWLNIGYQYFSFLLCIGLYLSAIGKGYRRVYLQEWIFMGSSLPPLAGYLVYICGNSPWGLDLAPMGMGVSALLCYIAIFNLQCFDTVPMARSQVFRAMRDAVLVTDMQCCLADFNPAAAQLFPSLQDRHLGNSVSEILSQRIDFDSSAWKKALEIELDGETHTFEARVLELGEKDFQSGWALILVDITDQMRLLEELQRYAQTDALTGIANRRHFTSVVEREYARMKRHPGSFALILIDVDDFKSINDKNGHTAGDQVLLTVTRTIESCLRASDTLCRFGGDEFAALLPQTTLESAGEVAERIRESVSELETATASGSFQVTLSLGLAAYDPENPKPWPGLMEEADQHLYQAKAQGRNCVRWPATEVAER